MANIVEQLKHWLLKKRPFRTKRLEKDSAYPSKVGESLSKLPDEVSHKLTTLLEELPSHPHNKTATREALLPAITRWRDDPDAANNSLTVLGSPVAAVARLLTDSLIDWAAENDMAINLLDWTERPGAPHKIQSKMQEALQKADSASESELGIAIIPNLGWCFLRTAEGLDGIDYLRDCLLSDRSQFWIIGSGQVGFQYLNSVLKLQAHCGEVIELPSLSGEELQNWLMPIIEALSIQLDEDSIQERLQDLSQERTELPFNKAAALFEELGSSLKSLFRDVKEEALSLDLVKKEDSLSDSQWEGYFSRLSDLSDGVSEIALQLFVKSIYYEKLEGESKEKLVETVAASDDKIEDYVNLEPAPMHRIIAKLPKLPNLPKLEQSDLYILYSLLVHDDLTLTALAESLGEERQLVNDSVQVLRQKGVVEQRGNVIKTNPTHYPRLKRQLASNNFVINLSD